MTSTPAGSSFVPPETPRAFARRADGFRHAAAGGLWLAPLVYLEHARFGPGWYGKVVSSDPERLLAWAISKAIPRRALEVKSLPDLDMPRHGRRRLPGYHIDLWGARLALAYDPESRTLFYTADNTAYRDLVAVDARTRQQRMLLRDARIGHHLL